MMKITQSAPAQLPLTAPAPSPEKHEMPKGFGVANTDGIDRESPLWQAAKGMEGQFMKEMLRNMRKTIDESEDEANDRGLQIFRGMLDDEYAEAAVRNQGIGLAELIVNQSMESQRAAQPPPAPADIRVLNKNDTVKK